MEQTEIYKIFDKIAENYDKINNFISLGTHLYIKKSVIQLLKPSPNSKVIDLCTGTGDIVKIFSKIYPDCKIIGIDNSEKMLKIAKQKNSDKQFINADCKNTPFSNNEFDFAIMTFGLRNIIDRESVLKEIYRILKNEGVFLHLDFGKHNFLNSLFNILLPLFSRIIGADKNSFKHLINSKKNYPEPDKLIKEFEKYGFELILKKYYLLGSISAQIFKVSKT